LKRIADLQFFPDKSEKFKLIPHKDGQIVGAGLLFQQAMQAFVSEKPAVISIEPMPIEAKVKTAHLENATSLITRFTTSMAGSTENRKHNIALALSKVNGTKLGPGEIFSWLDVVGTVSSKTGYKPAPVIKPDKSLQDGIGGGICQASSTLFNSAAMAGMEIVERYHHSFPISYLDPGLDATVSSYVNFRFRNPRNTPVFIRAYRSGDKAVVEFYGEPLSNNGEYKLTTKLIEKIPAPEPKRVLDKKGEYVTEPGGEHVHVKSREGLRINTYRILYENGKKVSTELLVKNYYKPIEGIIYYREGSTAPKPTTSPKPSQTPKPSQSPTTKPSESPDPEESQKPSPSSEPSESPKPTDNGE
jgi:vancomycin resistance protein YoaR